MGNLGPKRLYCEGCGRWTWTRTSELLGRGVLKPRKNAHMSTVKNYCKECFNKYNNQENK